MCSAFVLAELPENCTLQNNYTGPYAGSISPGEIRYMPGIVNVGYYSSSENIYYKDEVAQILNSLNLTFSDLGGIAYAVNVPNGTELEWVCKLQEMNPITFAEPEIRGTGEALETGSCDAYWKGYVYDVENKICKEEGASGCSNPFPYKTEQECKEANNIRGSSSLLIYYVLGGIIILAIVLYLIFRKKQ